ncbi:MAG TPA: HAD-IA family hydrolase [Vicinamibacterales bacterium]|nr:HAD-IA family hydrolase [Vicinamibacterales bacterium]
MTAPGRSATRAIFFDVDFTLIFPGPTFQGHGYARFCAEQGVTVDPARFDSAVAAASFILDEIEEPIYDASIFVHYTATIIEHMGGRGAEVVPIAERIYEQWATNHHFEIYDDVEPVLTDLASRGMALGVISNSHRSLEAFKEHFKLGALLTTTVSSAEHGYMKPHRSIFDKALAAAGVGAGQAVMVGDSLKADIEGAVAAGMRAVLVRRSGDIPARLPDGVIAITTLRDLPAHI